MIVRLGTSLVTAFVLYCLLFDVTSVYFSVTKPITSETASAPNSSVINVRTSSQPQNAVTYNNAHHLTETGSVKRFRLVFSKLATKFRNALNRLKNLVANFFGVRKSSPIPFIEKPNVSQVHRSISNDTTYPISWGGSIVTENEKLGLDYLNSMRNNISTGENMSPWLHTATSTDILRFLRARNGNAEEALKHVIAHAKWRTTQYGADTIIKENSFSGSAMNKEVFWLGISSTDCPTLVVRTQAHDGADYNEDPKIFTSFMVSIIEEGIRKYGVGTDRRVCVLLDRSTFLKAGVKKKEDLSVIPNLVKLFQHLYSTIIENYPDLLLTARILPASWFFSVCYKMTSRVMDPKSRAKFQTVKAEDIHRVMGELFPSEILPPHLGGTSALYGSNPLQNEHVVTTHTQPQPVLTLSTTQDNRELQVDGVAIDNMENRMAVEEADGIEKEEEESSEESTSESVLSCTDSNVRTTMDVDLNAPATHSGTVAVTVTVDRYEKLKSLDVITVIGEKDDSEEVTDKDVTRSLADNRMDVISGHGNRVCVGVCVGVTVGTNAVRGVRDSDVRVGMGGAHNSDRADMRTITNNNSNNNMNKNHYSNSYDNNEDMNDVNNDSVNNEYNDDNIKNDIEHYYGKSVPLGQEIGDSQRDFLDTIIA